MWTLVVGATNVGNTTVRGHDHNGCWVGLKQSAMVLWWPMNQSEKMFEMFIFWFIHLLVKQCIIFFVYNHEIFILGPLEKEKSSNCRLVRAQNACFFHSISKSNAPSTSWSVKEWHTLRAFGLCLVKTYFLNLDKCICIQYVVCMCISVYCKYHK